VIPYAQLFYQAAHTAQVSPYLLMAIAWVESRFDPQAVSESGAMGLMQFMPETWEEWGQGGDPFDPTDAIPAAARYLGWLSDQLDGDMWWAVVAYNWGIGRVRALREAGGNAGDLPPERFQYAEEVLDTTWRYEGAAEDDPERGLNAHLNEMYAWRTG
jgi:soluble lytic murein transglycosylase-like protein